MVERDHHVAHAVLFREGKRVASLPLVSNAAGRHVQQFELSAPGDYVVRIEANHSRMRVWRFVRVAPDKSAHALLWIFCAVAVVMALVLA